LLLLTALACFVCVGAQNVETDSLKRQLAVEKDQKKRVNILESLSYAYLSSYPDTALQYAMQGLELAKNIKFRKGEAICTNAIGSVYFHTGDNPRALEMYLQYLRLKEELKDYDNIAVAYFNIGSVYTEEEDYRHALEYFFRARREDQKATDTSAILYDDYSIAAVYQNLEKFDSALYYNNHAHQLAIYLDDKNMMGAVLNRYGEIYFASKDTARAARYYRQSVTHAEIVKDYEVVSSDYHGLAKIYKQQGMLDSSIYYAREAFNIAYNAPFFKPALQTSAFLSDLFKSKNRYDSAFHYQQLSIEIKDSLFNIEQVKKVQNLRFQEEQRQQSVAAEKTKYRNTIKLFLTIAISIIILIIAIVLWRNNKEKHKANLLLTEQKNKVESTLTELKDTQTQLIQSAKMASLGDLTAGIAHEIQNPLNFVNNFSEVNNELIEEVKSQKSKLKTEELDQLLNDIFQNNNKISFHGKRADAIVKAMLQHSRTSSAQKELTDINKLADEYLRLTYHGLRAKEKGFKATLHTHFDSSIGKINVMPQDIGRVFFNLLNNSFYAVNEKARQNIPGYEPTVVVSTKKSGNVIEIKVKDNGTGISEKILDKIFQPFFTTKPTGRGTGLGLSLAYDIVKAHGGEIKVETKEGEGSEFAIELPG
jgi:signal transduction histidine kinase